MLAEGEFYRVGGQTPIRVDVRVIAATHQDLEERVRRGQFREDLFHRLNVIRIELPPLRARREDVADLLQPLPAASPRTSSASRPRRWRRMRSQRLRRLRLARQRARAGEPVPAADGAGARQRNPRRGPAGRDHRRAAGAQPRPAPTGPAALAAWAERQSRDAAAPLLDEAMPAFERTLIRVALKRTQGHRQEAARLLGWGRNTLTRKLKELGMDDAD